jgi:hypothetical protein
MGAVASPSRSPPGPGEELIGMRTSIVCALALAAAVAGSARAAGVTGEYVEARSANVYIGACHREGEMLNSGRSALVAWKIAGGDHQGVSLKGVTAAAIVGADKHIDFADARRRTILYVSAPAGPAQQEAAVAWLRERAGSSLGEIVAVRFGAVEFGSADKTIQVRVGSVAALNARKSPGETCCKQPLEVWGKPLMPLRQAKVGFSSRVEYTDAGLLTSWKTENQNNVFFGAF